MTSYHRTRELFGAALYGGAIKAATTAQFKGKTFDITTADGQPLFSAAHPAKVSGPAQCNLFKDAFSVDALGQMETAMQIFCGDTEEILDVSPDTILIPDLASLKKDVFAAIGADKDPATSNNAFNYQFGRWTVICWPYLNKFITAGHRALDPAGQQVQRAVRRRCVERPDSAGGAEHHRREHRRQRVAGPFPLERHVQRLAVRRHRRHLHRRGPAGVSNTRKRAEARLRPLFHKEAAMRICVYAHCEKRRAFRGPLDDVHVGGGLGVRPGHREHGPDRGKAGGPGRNRMSGNH